MRSFIFSLLLVSTSVHASSFYNNATREAYKVGDDFVAEGLEGKIVCYEGNPQDLAQQNPKIFSADHDVIKAVIPYTSCQEYEGRDGNCIGYGTDYLKFDIPHCNTLRGNFYFLSKNGFDNYEIKGKYLLNGAQEQSLYTAMVMDASIRPSGFNSKRSINFRFFNQKMSSESYDQGDVLVLPLESDTYKNLQRLGSLSFESHTLTWTDKKSFKVTFKKGLTLKLPSSLLKGEKLSLDDRKILAQATDAFNYDVKYNDLSLVQSGSSIKHVLSVDVRKAGEACFTGNRGALSKDLQGLLKDDKFLSFDATTFNLQYYSYGQCVKEVCNGPSYIGDSDCDCLEYERAIEKEIPLQLCN